VLRVRTHQALILVGLVVSVYGGLALYGLDRSPGSSVAAIPLSALLLGVLLFVIGWWREQRRGPQMSSPILLGDEVESRVGRPWLWAAAFASVLSIGLYATIGYQPVSLLAWLASGVFASVAVWPDRRRAAPGSRLAPAEFVFLAGVLAGLALLVLPYASRLPYEISTDEIYLIETVREFAAGTASNPFGLVQWWGLPALYFAAVAKLALVTGTSLEAIRLLSGITALLVVIPFYFWVRVLHGRAAAVVATSLLAFAHVFIGWGRIALHQNSPVLILSLAFALLATGMRDRCPLRMLWGGVALGLGFYTYPSGQIAIFIWIVALAGLLLTRRMQAREARVVAAMSLLGFLLCVAPMLVNVFADFGSFTMRASAVSITNPDVQAVLSQRWGVEASAVVKENLTRGLLAFNHPYPYVTYYNPGHGFVDPVTGVLVWLGLGLAIVQLRRPGMLLAVVGLLGVYLPNLFTESAPTHGRLLIGLPFIAILSAEAVLGAVRALGSDPRLTRRVSRWSVATVIGAIVGLNLAAFRDYVRHQSTGKNDAVTAIGRTLGVGIETEGPLARFFGQEAAWDSRHHVVVISNEGDPAIEWGGPRQWHQWTAFFADSVNVHVAPDVDALLNAGERAYAQGFWNRLTVFLPTLVWELNEDRLRARYPGLRRWIVTPNRRLTAFEIQR